MITWLDSKLFMSSPILLLLAIVLYVFIPCSKARRRIAQAVAIYLVVWAIGVAYVRDIFDVDRKTMTKNWAKAIQQYHEKTGTYPLHELADPSGGVAVWFPGHKTSQQITISDLEAALRAEGIAPRSPTKLTHRDVVYLYANRITHCFIAVSLSRGGYFTVDGQGRVIDD